jgi:hypothetical protein
MATKYCSIVVPYAHTPVWIQICVAAFKAFKNDRDADILIVDNCLYGRGESIKAITETALGEGVTVIPQCKQVADGRYYTSHAAGIDYAIPFIKTPYMFSTESDVTPVRDGWLDWYASFVQDEGTAMVGWFWPARHYINPSWTLLNMRILRLIEAEVKNNKETTFVKGEGYRERFKQEHWESLIKDDLLGPFSEVRGFNNGLDIPGGVNHNVPAYGHDTGSWLYYRLSNQYECVRVPGDEVPMPDYQAIGAQPTKYQFVGPSEAEAYLLHHGAGTVSHNYEKHLIFTEWEALCIEWWLRREYRLWEEIVPEFVRKESLNKGLIPKFEDQLARALKSVHVLRIGDKVRAYPWSCHAQILGEAEESDAGMNAEVTGWDSDLGGYIARFENGKPPEGYHRLIEINGEWYATFHPSALIKRG